MADNPEIKTLIGSLQQLYSRMVQTFVHRRSSKLSKGGGGDAGWDIQALLSERLEKLGTAADGSAGAGDGDKPHLTVGGSSGMAAPSRHQGVAGGALSPETASHFHERGADDLIHSSVGEQIKARALEHVNKALLLARQGDKANSRLHADLTNSAVKEAARFMDREEYKEFVDLVKARLEEFGND